MSSNNTIFTGSSRYSTDFQQVIDRAVAIASLPLAQLESQKTGLEDQSSALRSVEAKIASVQSAIESLLSAVTSSAYTTSVTDASVLRASVSGSTLPGVYSVEVIDAGSYTATMSADGLLAVSDPSNENLSAASEFTLTVDGEEFAISTASNSLGALAEAINASDAEVEATIVNIGSPSSPDYRLSIRSSRLGNHAIQLNDGTGDLLETLAVGGLASYKVNGQPTDPITTDSRTVTLGPGLSVTLSKQGSAEITVGRDTSRVATAVTAFAASYNAAIDEIDRHRGESPGVLAGHGILYTLAASLRNITGYASDSGSVTSLSDLGLTFDDQGKLSFDAGAFSLTASDQYSELLDFLGGADSDGFLAAATSVLDGLENSTDGVLHSAVTSFEDQIDWQTERIDREQERVDQVEKGLRAQMAAADALIAALEQQANYFNSLFASMLDTRVTGR